MAQAPLEHGFPFDFLSLFHVLFGASEVDVGGRQVAEALMVPAGVAVLDERVNCRSRSPGRK